MCGIAGIISNDPRKINAHVLQEMAGCMLHRGPNGEATWISATVNAGFSHARLAVIDLSESASQPMHFGSRYTIVYNGELYNYLEVRNELKNKGVRFLTESDTEVILAAYSVHGTDCLHLFDGMFAFAIWDEETRQLFCARDRFGEKPFYYHLDAQQATFYFSSEMKGIHAAGVELAIDNSMLLRFFALGDTSDPLNHGRTFYKNIHRLRAAHYLLVTVEQSRLSVDTHRYWDIKKSVRCITLMEAGEKLKELLKTSVSRRLRSDVSTGMSLSGGLDSSSIAATIRLLTSEPMSAFTAVFDDFDRDESARAELIASRYRMDHHMVKMSAQDLGMDLERVIKHQEEPFTSASVFAQFKVFEAARQMGTTVLLDGQGADEVLAGYHKYLNWRQYSLAPRLTSSVLEFKQRLSLGRNNLLDRDFVAAYRSEVGFLKPRVRELNDLLYYNTFINGLEELLRYADRNAMAHGREVRLPFLFHELVEFAFSLPDEAKIGNGYTKLVLRTAFAAELPEQTVWDKRKIGFEPPQKQWMQTQTVKDLWNSAKRTLYKQGVLSKKGLEKGLVAHDAYARDSFDWRVLISGIWLTVINKKGV